MFLVSGPFGGLEGDTHAWVYVYLVMVSDSLFFFLCITYLALMDIPK